MAIAMSSEMLNSAERPNFLSLNRLRYQRFYLSGFVGESSDAEVQVRGETTTSAGLQLS